MEYGTLYLNARRVLNRDEIVLCVSHLAGTVCDAPNSQYDTG